MVILYFDNLTLGTVTGNSGPVSGGSAGGGPSGVNTSVAGGGGIVGIGANKNGPTTLIAGGQGSVSNNTAEQFNKPGFSFNIQGTNGK